MPIERDALVRVLARVRAGPRLLREHQGAVTVVVAAALAAAAVVAGRQLDLRADEIDWGLVSVAALVGVPATALANGLEHRAIARSLGIDLPVLSALRVTVTATAANLLPLPGGIVVRTEDLTYRGGALREVGRSTLAAAATWATIGSVAAAAGLLATGSGLTALVAAGVAVAAAGVAVVLGLGRGRSATSALLVAESIAVGAAALRTLLLLAALGRGFDPARALVLSASGIVSQSVGFLPAGIGLREAASAGLAAVVALPAAVGLLTAVLDRVIGLGVHAVIGLGLWRLHRAESGARP